MSRNLFLALLVVIAVSLSGCNLFSKPQSSGELGWGGVDYANPVASTLSSANSSRVLTGADSSRLSNPETAVSFESRGGSKALGVKTISDSFTMVGSVVPPKINGGTEVIGATYVAIYGNLAYVAYNTRGEAYGGAIDVIDISDPEYPEIVDTIILTDTDISALFVSTANKRLYAAGARDPKSLAAALGLSSTDGLFPAVLERFSINDTGSIDPADKSSMLTVVPGQAANGIFETTKYVFATAGNTDPAAAGKVGGTFALNVGDFKLIDADYYKYSQFLDIDPTFKKHVSLQAGPAGVMHVYKVGVSDASSHKTIDIGEVYSPSYNGIAYQGKNTVDLYNDIAFAAMGPVMNAYDTLSFSKKPVYQVKVQVPSGENTDDYSCGSVAVDGKYIYMASGRQLQIAELPGVPAGSATERETTVLPVAGIWDTADETDYLNFVAADESSGLFFVASSNGLKIMKRAI